MVRTVPLAGYSRTTVTVHADQSGANPGGLGRLNTGHTTKIEASLPVTVERPMYFRYADTITGGHVAPGFGP